MLNTKLHLNRDALLKGVGVKSVRQALGDALIELSKDSNKIFVLTADLASSLKVQNFAQIYPDHFIQVGIAEQNMASIATGMALSGKIPFITSFAIFNPGRNWEQIRNSICMSNANVKIIGGHAGLSHSFDGGVAQALEDIALTRVLPRMIVLSPCDYEQMVKAVEFSAKHKGPVYIRVPRTEVPEITTGKTPFEMGSAQKLVEGKDITIVATGTMVYESLVAAKQLKSKYKITADVLNVHTIKPLDDEIIIQSAKKTGLVVSVEDHQIIGGLGGAVAELLSEKLPVKIIRIGVHDKFGESGTYEDLKSKYGLSADQIVVRILKEKHVKKTD